MSILDKLRRTGHLDDAALAAIWTDGSVAGAQPSHPHLQVCAGCRYRFASLATWLEDLRVDAAAEADELFPPERLAAQQAQIFRRLEAAGRPARVIAFPKFTRPLTSGSSGASRWIAAAAAAGLMVGVGVGQIMNFRPSLSVPQAPSSNVRAVDAQRPDRADIRASSTSGGEDELFLSELDATLSGPALPELRALDELTPRAGERTR